MSGAIPPLPLCLYGLDREKFAFTFKHVSKRTHDLTESCFVLGPRKFIYLFITAYLTTPVLHMIMREIV